MSVTEAHQARGRWSLTLKAETPRSVREKIGLLGHVMVTPGRISKHALNTPDDIYPGTDVYPETDRYPNLPLLQRTSRYTGVVLRVPRGDDRTVSGYGLAWWLGHGSEGPILQERIQIEGSTSAGLMQRLLPLEIRPGVGINSATVFSGTVEAWQTVRDALDYTLGLIGCEWRVNPDGTMDAGPPDDLFGVDPLAIAVRDGGWEVDLEALQVASLGMASDAENWVSDLTVLGRGRDETYVQAEASRNSGYVGLWGDEARRTALVHDTQTEEANAEDRAVQLLHDRAETRREVSLSVDDFHIDGDVKLGCVIGVYDPEQGIYDTTNRRQWRGQVIYPLHLRVLGMTWPITRDHGVYYVAPGTTLDLTDHIEAGAGATTVEVGAAPRSLTNLDLMRQAMAGRLRGGPLYIGGRL